MTIVDRRCSSGKKPVRKSTHSSAYSDQSEIHRDTKWNTERSRKEAIRNAARTADLLVKAVNGGVEECFVNEKRIESEIRNLAVTVARFGKQTDQWLAATHAVNSAVKVSSSSLRRVFSLVLSCLFANDGSV